MTTRSKQPEPEPRFDLFLRRAARIAGLIGFIVLLAVYVTGREVSSAWLFLIGGMIAIDGLTTQITGRK